MLDCSAASFQNFFSHLPALESQNSFVNNFCFSSELKKGGC